MVEERKMKTLMRFGVFASGFVIGVGAVQVSEAAFPGYQHNVRVLVDKPVDDRVFTGRVDVEYLGYEMGENPSLKFAVRNGLYAPLSHRDYSAADLWPVVTANGKELGLSRCGEGLEEYYVLPGRSVVVNVPVFHFRDHDKKTDEFTVSFYLRTPLTDKYESYSSTPFHLPDDIREHIRTSPF